ncbi:MAG: SAM-dependent methyltransferase [Gammaproteobacteria bacterium]
MWDERYSADEYVFGKEPNRFLEEHFARMPKGKVLCLAEGEGRNAVFLARQGYEVTAVDASAVGLAKARRLAEEHGVQVRWICADLAGYDPGVDQWDGIVSIFCHLSPDARRPLHARLPGALKRGGVLLLEAYTPDQLAHRTGGPSNVGWMMTPSDLATELPGLVFNRLQELEREIVAGRHHHGMSAVVQLIAEKSAQ